MAHVSRNVWTLFVFRFFQSLIPAYVIERLYWEQQGMTIQMVIYTEILYAVTILLLEIPTGILADRWSRRNLLLFSAVLGCVEFAILIHASTFWHFAAAVLLAGIGRSASSGAEQALLYDSLLQRGQEQDFEKVLGRLNACDLVAAILAALCGSLLAGRFPLELNYHLSLASTVLALVAALLLVEPAVSTRDEGEAPLPIRVYLSASLRFFQRNPGVRLVVLTGMVSGSALGFIYEFWQLYLERQGVGVVYFGPFSAALMVFMLPGSMLAYRLKNRFGSRRLFFIISAVFAAGFVYMSAVHNFTAWPVIFLICLFSGMVEPLTAGYLHHRTDSAMRATIGSFQSLGENGVHALMGLGFGFLSSRLDVFGGYGFIALACTLFVVYFWFHRRQIAEEPEPESDT